MILNKLGWVLGCAFLRAAQSLFCLLTRKCKHFLVSLHSTEPSARPLAASGSIRRLRLLPIEDTDTRSVLSIGAGYRNRTGVFCLEGRHTSLYTNPAQCLTFYNVNRTSANSLA